MSRSAIAIVIVAGGPRIKRMVRRTLDRAGIAPLDRWQPWDSGGKQTISVCLPVPPDDANSMVYSIDAAWRTGDGPRDDRRTFAVTTGTVPAGRGWDTDARVIGSSGSGDRHAAAALRSRCVRERVAPYIRSADVSAERDAAVKDTIRILGEQTAEMIGPDACLAVSKGKAADIRRLRKDIRLGQRIDMGIPIYDIRPDDPRWQHNGD